MQGRPLRFLGLVLGGWILVRLVVLWSYADAAVAMNVRVAARAVVVQAVPPPSALAVRRSMARYTARLALPSVTASSGIDVSIDQPVFAGSAQPVAPATASRPPPTGPQETPIVAGLPPAKPPPAGKRWSGSFWLVARNGGGAGTAFTGPQLGGSQVGLRVAYALDRRHRLAVAARIASPLGTGEREAAVGLEWQPTRLPVRLVAEQRFALNQGRGGPTIGLVGGVGPVPIGPHLLVEGYAQAGYIARDGHEGEAFGDGAIRLSHPLGDWAGVKLDLGASAWGAAQRGARRLDVGPSLAARMRIAHQPVRLSLEWRQRVAGNATPASGPALSLGADF